jgi:uroporphyrinogen decarboxylase
VLPEIFEDEFGVRWNRSIDKDIGTVCNRMITPETLDGFEFPDPADPLRWEGYPKKTDGARTEFVVANLGFSLFERAWTLCGMEALLIGMIDDPDFVHRLLDRILEHNLALVGRACSYDIDAMMFGDDWGSQRGLLMGGKLWTEFIKPQIAEMYSAVRSAGKYVFIHSCGKVDELFPDLIEAGVHVFNPFQPEVMDVFAMKKMHGDRLSFYGGISTQRTLPYGTVEQTKEEVKRLLEVVGEGGGYIAAPAHAIPADAKAGNIAAMIEVLQGQ